MPATSIFDYGLLGYLSQNQSWTSSSEEGNSFFIDSSEGGGNGAVYFETDFGTTNHENHNEPEGETNVVAVVAAMASSTINSSLSTISQTIGEYLTTPFSDLASAEIMMSYNNNTLGDTISHSSGTPQNLSELSKGELEKSSLKLPSATIPESFRKLSTNSRNCVIAYVILFCIGAPGNLFVFVSVGREIWRRQLMRSRIKVLIWHLATADLFVTFVVIPIEVFWRLTIQWYGGDVLCKMAQFFRAFGLYLSSMVIICISMDRFFAIVFPLKVIGGMKRVRNMLGVAWTFSILFAAPQVLTFSVQKHPLYPSFLLCSNSDYFLSLSKEIMYNLLSLIVMYFAPLLVIIVTYAMVLYTIARKSREHHQDCRSVQGRNRKVIPTPRSVLLTNEMHHDFQNGPRSGSNQLRRSDNASNITRARRKTLWLSMVIVTVFVICWTPYVTMTLWYMFDFETAANVDPRIHEALFVTAVSNSCVNPIIYGNYMKKYWRNLRNAACRSRTSSTSSSRIASSSRTHNHHRAVSTYRCTNPNHHFNLSPRCQSATASDVTIMEHTAFGTTGSVISPARITSASAPAASQTELPRPVFV